MTADGAADWENKQLRQDENNSLEIGDPKILWSIGGKFFMDMIRKTSLKGGKQITWLLRTTEEGS